MLALALVASAGQAVHSGLVREHHDLDAVAQVELATGGGGGRVVAVEPGLYTSG